MRASKLSGAFSWAMIALSLISCMPLAKDIEHTPITAFESPTPSKILFGSAERERYIVHPAPFNATNVYPVNRWFRDKLARWSAALEPTDKKAQGHLQITLTNIMADLDTMGDDGLSTPGLLSPGRGDNFPGYVSVHKKVSLHFTASLQKSSEEPCTQAFVARAKEHRALWIALHPFNSAYDFKQIFRRTIDDAIGQLDGWSCWE